VPFAATAALQERLRQDVIAGRAPETLLLLEHDPVITLGRSAQAANILAAPEELQRRGIAVHPVSRGGDVTYHGPGQLVGYPIVRLRGGVVGHMRAMADGLAAVLAGQGIVARWDRQAPGLWVEASAGGAGVAAPPAKLCAFGVHVRQRVTMHGFALNVTTALDSFSLIVPCGLAGVSVTSMKQLRGQTPSLPSLATMVAEAFARSFALPFERVYPQALAASSTTAPLGAPLRAPLGAPVGADDGADGAFVVS
jgi:lipoyl(octanoyl) transferase